MTWEGNDKQAGHSLERRDRLTPFVIGETPRSAAVALSNETLWAVIAAGRSRAWFSRANRETFAPVFAMRDDFRAPGA